MKKIAVIFGGMSTENEISVKSAKSILDHLDKSKYEIVSIYIDKVGNWHNYETEEKIKNIIEELKKVDIVFPVLHGLGGEDGTIQGMLELFKIPYVGCKVLASCLGMDKAYSKMIFEKAKINQAKYIYVKALNNDQYIVFDSDLKTETIELKKLVKICCDNLSFPMFVKPSNSGSSIGVSKVENNEELENAILEAAKFDCKILIEQGILGKEVECAVLR